MDNQRYIIPGRLDELPTLGAFSRASYIRDQAAFSALKPLKYVTAWLTDFDAKLAAVNAILYPQVIVEQLKVVTARMDANLLGLMIPMNHLEAYIRDLPAPTIDITAFGIQKVRLDIHSDDIEALNGALAYLIGNVDANLAALELIGYLSADHDALIATKAAFLEDNTLQNTLEDQISQLSSDNIGVFNEFAKLLKDLWADGKSIYKGFNSDKLKDYTYAQMQKRMRNDQLHTVINGIVFDNTGAKQKGSKIVARPTGFRKRGKTVKADVNAFYYIKGMIAQEYSLLVTLPNGHQFLATVTAITNETVTLDLHEAA